MYTPGLYTVQEQDQSKYKQESNPFISERSEPWTNEIKSLAEKNKSEKSYCIIFTKKTSMGLLEFFKRRFCVSVFVVIFHGFMFE